MSFVSSLVLYPQQPRAVVEIHEVGTDPSGYEMGLQVVKEYGPAGPSISLLPAPQSLPCFKRLSVFIEDLLSGTLTQKHFTDNGFDVPKAALFPEVYTLGALV